MSWRGISREGALVGRRYVCEQRTWRAWVSVVALKKGVRMQCREDVWLDGKTSPGCSLERSACDLELHGVTKMH